jgi:hypothetical protein
LTVSKKFTVLGYYFPVSRILTLSWIIYAYYSVDSTYISSDNPPINIALALAYIGLSIISLAVLSYCHVNRWLNVAATIIATLGFIGLITMQANIGPNASHSSFAFAQSELNTRHDLLTSSDLTDLANCLDEEGVTDSALPTSLRTVIDKCGDAAGVNEVITRLKNYTYKIIAPSGSNMSYQLCAIFLNSASGSTSTGDYRANNHGKGYQCFTYSAYGTA